MSYSEVNGDLIAMAKDGKFDVIVHGCNCFCTMGAGVAAQIKKVFPEAYDADRSTAVGIRKVGKFTWAQSRLEGFTGGPYLSIINAYTQFSYGHGKDLFEYEGFRNILKQLRLFLWPNARIGFPKIGTGLAGGDWPRIKQIIQEELGDRDVTVVIYE